MRPRYVAVAAAALFLACFASSLIHPWGNPRSGVNATEPLLAGSDAPANVQHVLETKCADCHSERTTWPAYSRLAPASWLIERDVIEGRSHLNLSQWQIYTAETRIDLLSRIASEARSGQMPVRQYLILHPQARLSPEEQQLIYDWAKSERKRIRRELAGPQTSPPQTDSAQAKQKTH
jgi:cytochrome c